MKVLKNKAPIARKEHRCEFCGEVIHVGEKYNRQTNVYDGCIYDWVSHCDCSQLACELDMFDDSDNAYRGKEVTEDDIKVICWFPIPSFDEILEANRDVLERIKEKGD